MGKIRVADFNGDGNVDDDDRSLFDAQWLLCNDGNPSQNRGVTVYATCDVNEDGLVDITDYNKFHEWWNQAMSNHDLGPEEIFRGPYGL